MNKFVKLGVAALASIAVLGPAQPAGAAEARAKWDGSTVEIINKLPSDWPVGAAVSWLDVYTGSRFKFVKTCSKTARRCITIKQGRLKGYKTVTENGKKVRVNLNQVTGWSSGSTITIDTWKAKNVKPFKGKFNYATKKYLLAHEVGHQRFLDHTKSCNNVMQKNMRCAGHVPPLRLTTSQKKTLAGY
jgi:hypothetical protein